MADTADTHDPGDSATYAIFQNGRKIGEHPTFDEAVNAMGGSITITPIGTDEWRLNEHETPYTIRRVTR